MCQPVSCILASLKAAFYLSQRQSFWIASLPNWARGTVMILTNRSANRSAGKTALNWILQIKPAILPGQFWGVHLYR
jgi:hypothetical protein